MKILDIALKDLVRSSRSYFLLGMALAAPLLLTGLIYFAFSGMASGDVSMTAIKVGVVNLDELPADSVIDTPIGNNIRSMFFDESVKSWISATDYPDEAAARAAVNDQEIGVAVVVPRAFTASYLSGEKDAQVLIVSDPTLSIGPAVVEDMVTMMVDAVAGGGIAIQTLIEREQANGNPPDMAQIPVWIERFGNWYREFQRDLFHRPDRAALLLVAPASSESSTANPLDQMIGLTLAGQIIFFAFFTGGYAMMSILREGEEGTLARLFTTPTHQTSILSGKFIAVFLTVLLQGVILLAAGGLAFKITWGLPASVALSLIAQVVAAAGMGVLLIAFVKTTKQGGPVLGGALTVMGMLGGLFWVNIPGGMPEAFSIIAKLVPQGWVLESWQLTLDGLPPSDLLLPFTVSVVMGVTMLALGARMFRRRYA